MTTALSSGTLLAPASKATAYPQPGSPLPTKVG